MSKTTRKSQHAVAKLCPIFISKLNDDMYVPILGNAGKLCKGKIPDEVVSDAQQSFDKFTQSPTSPQIDRYLAFVPNASKLCGDSRVPDGAKFLVIGHGDYWSQNIMYRRDANGELQLVIIDFQECMYTKPSTDLGID